MPKSWLPWTVFGIPIKFPFPTHPRSKKDNAKSRIFTTKTVKLSLKIWFHLANQTGIFG